MSAKEPVVALARLGSPNGVRGALNVNQAGHHLRGFVGKKITVCKVTGGEAGILTNYTIKGDFTLLRAEPAKGDVTRVQFSEINDRDAAAALTNHVIAAPLAALRAAATAERKNEVISLTDLWYFELLGLSVLDAESGKEIGRIAAVEDLGLNTTVTIEPAAAGSLIVSPLEIPLEYPHWQKPDLSERRIALAEWRAFLDLG